MKTILKTIILSAGILGMSSCSDFLEQNSPSELNTETVFNSTYYAGLSLNKVYGDLTLDQTYSQYIPIVWGLNSDCELVDGLGSNATNATSERGNMNYNANPGWDKLARLWDSMYGIIENANLTIEGIENSPLLGAEGEDKKTMLRYQSEALTLRAMIYFDLIRFFGDIPMKMESTATDLSNVYLGKTDRDVIMDKLIEDLKKAIDNLPWAGQGVTTEHVNKGYAHALLANIALTRAGWNIRESSKEGYETATVSDATYPTQRCGEEKRKEMYELALTHLNEIIQNGPHSLNTSIDNHWILLNQRELDEIYRENIFEIAMGLGKTGELGYTVGVRINGASEKYGLKGNSSGKLKLTAPFFWSFDKKDQRRDITCAPYELKETDGVLKEEFQGNKPFELYCAKWDIRKMDDTWRQAAINAQNAKWMTGINVVRMRYPQVLLMYAEVMNELKGCDVAGASGLSARDALKMVHVRAYADADKVYAADKIDAIPSDKTSFFAAIVDENAWELAGEGFRKFDLIRWNLLEAKIEEFKQDYQYQVENEYPEKLYFKYKANSFDIEMATVHWYGEPDDTSGYESKDFYGKEKTASTQTQLDVNLPSISSGLSNSVINRYLLPIASTTISASNGSLHNSYGYTD